MPLYTFRCSVGHEVDRRMSIDSITAYDPGSCEQCGMELRRVFNSTGRGLMRPKGYRLKPDEPGYFDLPREEEERFGREWLQNHGHEYVDQS